jgi:hypothetical protein
MARRRLPARFRSLEVSTSCRRSPRARSATSNRMRRRPCRLIRSRRGSPARFQASSAPFGLSSRNRLVARILAACASCASRCTACRAAPAACPQFLRSACRPAISRHGAPSAGHCADASCSRSCAGSRSPARARRTPSATISPHGPEPPEPARSASAANTTPVGPALSSPGSASIVQNPEAAHARAKSSSSTMRNGARAGS